MKTEYDKSSERELLWTRRFNAPRERVWAMWTQADHLRQWWGPEGWSLPVCELDLRVGGVWFYCMEGPENMTSCGKSTYLEIDAPERLVHIDEFADADGTVLDTFPAAHITVEFVADKAQTTVRSTTRYDTRQQRDAVVEMGVEAGMDQTLDRLEAYLATTA